MGLGAAPNLKYYAASVERIIGIDPNAAMRPYAEAAAAATGAAAKLTLLPGRAEALPLPDACADAVIMTHVRWGGLGGGWRLLGGGPAAAGCWAGWLCRQAAEPRCKTCLPAALAKLSPTLT